MVDLSKYANARENRQTRGVCHLPRRWLFSRAHAYFSDPTICEENDIYGWPASAYSKEIRKEEFREARPSSSSYSRELKQQRWRRLRLRKRHLWSEFALPQTLSRLFHLVQFVKCWHIFLDLNFKELYQSSRKEKESCCLVFTSSTKRETRHFRVLRNVPKSVMYVQSCCFANKTCCFFAVLVAVAVVFAQAP